MEYQALSTELLGSFWLIANDEFITELESMQLYGNSTRIDTREQYCRATDSQVEHVFRLSIYRPGELVAGTRCLVRTVKKSRKGTWMYKIIIIPNPVDFADKIAGLEQVDPHDFWKRAYWQYIHVLREGK